MALNTTLLVLTILSFQLFSSGNGQVEPKSYVGACEFDLIDELLTYDPHYFKLLPEECLTAYNNPELRRDMAYESSRFADFMNLLSAKEKWDEQAEDEGRESLSLDFDLRKNVYSSANGNCTAPSDSIGEYIECMSNYREQLITAISESD